MSIEISNVTKYYGSQKALNEVSFNISTGEVVGFLGPNGAGKSTMMKIITCYLPPSSGSVVVAGFDIYEDSLKVRRNVGYLPENNPLYPEMYIREYLHFVAGIYGLRNKKSRVDDMIEMVGLTPERHKRIGELSKGYRQRVGLAQALIHDPAVLILDEPTSGLDPNQLEDIRQLIRKIGKQKTVMLSTHIMQEVEAMCDRAIIIKRGDIVADSPVELLKQTSHTEFIHFRIDRNVAMEKIRAIKGVLDVKQVENGHYKISAQKEENVIRQLTVLAAAETAQIDEIRKEERMLEEVFKTLTK